MGEKERRSLESDLQSQQTKLRVSKEKHVFIIGDLRILLRVTEWKRNDTRMSERIAMPTFYIVLSTHCRNTVLDFHILRMQNREQPP